MSFNDLEMKKIEKTVGSLCRKRSPANLKDQIRVEYRIKGHDVLIVEIRPRWDKPEESSEADVALLRFMRTRNQWNLLWKRASGKWGEYIPNPENQDIGVLVAEIDEDPHGCFWG